MSTPKRTLKERFRRIFAKTDIPIKSDPGKTVKNVVYVSGSKTWKARIAGNEGQEEGGKQAPTPPTFNFVVDPNSPESPRSDVSLTNGSLPGNWDRLGSLERGWGQQGQQSSWNTGIQQQGHGSWSNNGQQGGAGNTGVSAQFVSGSHPDVEYFSQQSALPVAPPKGKSKDRQFKDKNTYRHQYFIKKTQEQEEEPVPTRPGKLEVDAKFKQNLLKTLGGGGATEPPTQHQAQHSSTPSPRVIPPPPAPPPPPPPPPLPTQGGTSFQPQPNGDSNSPTSDNVEIVYHNIAGPGGGGVERVEMRGVQTSTTDTLGPLPHLKLQQQKGAATPGYDTQLSPGSQYSQTSTIRDFMLSSPPGGVYSSVIGGASTINSLTYSMGKWPVPSPPPPLSSPCDFCCSRGE